MRLTVGFIELSSEINQIDLVTTTVAHSETENRNFGYFVGSVLSFPLYSIPPIRCFNVAVDHGCITIQDTDSAPMESSIINFLPDELLVKISHQLDSVSRKRAER